VSVVMPCFNSARSVAASVESALGQTIRDLELIVVDNGSSDETVAIVKKIADSRIRVLDQSIRGVSAARNMGIDEARGEFIAFLDSDDTWDAECLEKLYAALVSRPDAVLTYCGWQNVGLRGGRGEPFIPPDYERPDKIQTLLGGCRWPIHAALTRTIAIRDAGRFDDRFAYAEDFGLWLRVAAFSRIVRVPEVLAYYHHHDGLRATTGDPVRAAYQLRAAQRDFLRQHPKVDRMLGRRLTQRIVDGELLRRGMEAYWARDLDVAHAIFRMVLKAGYLTRADLRYVLPALLPRSTFRALVSRIDRKRNEDAATGA
jgi:glycosyltransferase involved in cell wall biosynthesis